MSDFKADIAFGIFVFPFVALLLTVPYAVYEYRKYGSVPPLHTLLFYSFLLYAICTYFLVIFPLPEIGSYTPRKPQLQLFHWLSSVKAIPGFVASDPSTWLLLRKSTDFMYQVLNVIMTVPLGFFMRYFFKLKWWMAFPLAFATTLFFELTQLSGLYGIYPSPYRTFDVDDLFMNTLGCAIGYLFTCIIVPILPSMDRSEERAAERGTRVTAVRRFMSVAVDAALVAAAYVGLVLLMGLDIAGVSDANDLASLAALGIVVILVPLVFGGGTIGQRLLKMVVIGDDGLPAPRWRIVVRNALLYFLILPLPFYSMDIASDYLTGRDLKLFLAFEAAVFGTMALSVLFRAIRSRRTGRFALIHGMLTKTDVAVRD